MRSENFVIIQGWMCNDLKLKGNELLVYALIYGFSQDGISKFKGSRQYISDTFNISLPTVDKSIDNLLAKKLIEREMITDEKGNHYEYEVGKETLPGEVKFLYLGGKETLLNNNKQKDNIEKNNNFNKLKLLQDFGKNKQQPKSLYTKCLADINSRNYNETLRIALIDYLNVRLQITDKPLYANSWKGLLNKLEREFSEDERLQVVYQSIERGYASFFPVNKGFNKSNNQLDKPWEKGVTSRKRTEQEETEREEWLAEMRKKGVKVDF